MGILRDEDKDEFESSVGNKWERAVERDIVELQVAVKSLTKSFEDKIDTLMNAIKANKPVPVNYLGLIVLGLTLVGGFATYISLQLTPIHQRLDFAVENAIANGVTANTNAIRIDETEQEVTWVMNETYAHAKEISYIEGYSKAFNKSVSNEFDEIELNQREFNKFALDAANTHGKRELLEENVEAIDKFGSRRWTGKQPTSASPE